MYIIYIHLFISFRCKNYCAIQFLHVFPTVSRGLYDHGPVADSPGAKETQHEAAHSDPESNDGDPWLEVSKDGFFTLQVCNQYI